MKSLSAALSMVALLPESLAANATVILFLMLLFPTVPSRALFNYFKGLDDHFPNASGVLASRGMASWSAGMCGSDDVDDGSVNDSGRFGHTWYFIGISRITFTFSAAEDASSASLIGAEWFSAHQSAE